MNIKMIVASASLAVAASAASAQEAPPILLTLTPSGGALVATFKRPVSGLFVDTFSFTPTSVAGTVSVTLTPVNGSVNFFAALLNDEGFSFLPELGQASFSFQSAVNASTPLALTVFGFAGDAETLGDMAGSYSGSIQVQGVSAIPEPQTWALMLAGLGVVGFSARRRRQAPHGQALLAGI